MLQPVLHVAESSDHLEVVFSFCAVLLQVMRQMHDLLERRSFGSVHLSTSVTCWTRLERKVRVSLFLSHRSDHHLSLSVRHLELCCPPISVHRLLAADSLLFASNASEASAHDQRCLQAFSNSSDASLPLPWGERSDLRYKEVVAATVGGGGGGRRRRPLLLFFPLHYNYSVFGAHRCFLLMERWEEQHHQPVELVVLATEHVYSVAAIGRAAVSADVVRKHLLPFLLDSIGNNGGERRSSHFWELFSQAVGDFLGYLRYEEAEGEVHTYIIYII